MRVLVSGGAGYIGSHTVRLLERTAARVVVYDSLVKGHRQAVRDSILVEGDIFNTALLQETLRRHEIDAVVHFAAYSLVGESMREPRLYYHNNVSGTLCLLEAMRAAGVNRLVFSSTAAVYGEPAETPILETARLQPTNVYGRTKWMMEAAMRDYASAYGLRYIALRYFNACGADAAGDIGEDHSPETHLIPLVLKSCLGQGDVKIFGGDYPTPDGTCVRDYVHVTDLAQAHVLALEALAAGCGPAAYNLGSGSGFSVREIIAAAEKVTGRAIPVTCAPRRGGDPAVLIAGSDKIRRELQWRPRYDHIEAIIASAWRWHLSHPDGYQ